LFDEPSDELLDLGGVENVPEPIMTDDQYQEATTSCTVEQREFLELIKEQCEKQAQDPG